MAAGAAAVLVHNCAPQTVRAGTEVYRGDTRDPSEIFSKGFVVKGANMSLEEHAAGISEVYTPKSGFIGTAMSEV
jgi:hypothetical protein